MSFDANDDFNLNQLLNISELLPVNLDSNFENSTHDTGAFDYKIQIAMDNNIETQLNNDKEHANILVRYIAWTSSPLISKRMLIKSSDLKPTTTQIIESIDGEYSILSEWSVGSNGGRVILYSILINEYNKPFTLWPYFNYLMYVSIFHVKADFSDDNIESFAQWPYSPIPHLLEIIMWFSMIGVLWIITFYWFFKFRKRKIEDRNVEVPLTQTEIN